MTILDLICLLRRYLALVIILPVVFALVTAGFIVMRDQSVSYSANAYIVVGTGAQLSTLAGTASSSAREFTTANPGYSAAAKAESASLTVIITTSGPDESDVIGAANEIADAAVERANDLLVEEAVTAQIEKATSSNRQSSGSPTTYVFISLLAGLFAAICVVVGIDAVRRPLKNSADLEASSGLPVIGELPDDSGERLLANTRFANQDNNPRNVLIMPVHEDEPAAFSSMLIDHAARNESSAEAERHGGFVRVSACASLLQDITAVYSAREADAVVIAASQWSDSCKDVEQTVTELKLAGTNAIGCIFVKSIENWSESRKAQYIRGE